MPDARTNYLPAAITRAILATNDVSLTEIVDELPQFFVGSATDEEVERELSALVRGGSIESYEVGGVTYYCGEDGDRDEDAG